MRISDGSSDVCSSDLIGSDSHISVSPVEELRWLEYGQRLVTHHRNIAVGAGSTSVGETLLQGVAASRAQSTGFDHVDDHILLDAAAPSLAGATGEDIARSEEHTSELQSLMSSSY